jgi:hypothetical protein
MMKTAEQFSRDTAAQDRDALMGRLLESAVSTFNIFSVHIGTRLGFYRELAAVPLPAADLAARTHTHSRYVREWLEQQTVAGILRVDNPNSPPDKRLFSLPDGHREVLVNRESLNFLAPLAQITVGALSPLDKLIEAFCHGGGVAYEDYGVDLVEGQEGMNRAAFLYQLGQEWLPAIPDVHKRLQADGARIADLGPPATPRRSAAAWRRGRSTLRSVMPRRWRGSPSRCRRRGCRPPRWWRSWRRRPRAG